MAIWTYETLTQTMIPNTTMEKGYADGILRIYRITPNEGYVLHDKENDEIIIEPDTMEETKHLWYVSGNTTCGANYDFSPIAVTDENGVELLAYGERDFFVRPKSDVKNEIF